VTFLANLPFRLHWLVPPAGWSSADGGLTIDAGPKTDSFVDPDRRSEPLANAPALVGNPDGAFTLSARVNVDFAATFDAGVLLLHADERSWAKLCFEYSPRADPMIVSVVTRGVSDDCNSLLIAGHSVWLRVSRLDHAFAFHASTDGRHWQFVRHFALDAVDALAVGFQAQSPQGDGCRATFDEIRFEPRRLNDLRAG
jgi:regulation of enolase protein 1 (concanavalin A-like superfamily)